MSVFDEGIHQSVRMSIKKDFQSIRALGILSMKYEGMEIRTSKRPIPISYPWKTPRALCSA